MSRDHPRSRGVYGDLVDRLRAAGGSSPLARGLRRRSELGRERPRIIPARAGFTSALARAASVEADHPRSRGVYQLWRAATLVRTGSSPLARGLPPTEPLPRWRGRIIPARAGFTTPNSSEPSPRWDHPRSRGVYAIAAGACRCGWGIIPARAGFTPSGRRARRLGPDHPRSRGVYLVDATLTYCCSGSSPLARGLHEDGAGGPVVGGIIPARAGFTRRGRARAPTSADHPRSRGVYERVPRPNSVRSRIIPARAGFTSCRAGHRGGPTDHPRSRGVYASLLSDALGHDGSSPLARGLRGLPPVTIDKVGIIPARAGFTRARRRSACPVRDHPRSRGVYVSPSGSCSRGRGSSPLARGLRRDQIWAEAVVRIIPARAGFTSVI